MTYLYKLGDGPINYEWNHRYAWLEGSELFYSPSLDDREKKTLNISGAAVTNICKIKNKDYAFGIILNPPTNKIIYFAFDDLEETERFREKVVDATLNRLYEDSLAMNEFGTTNNNLTNNLNMANNISISMNNRFTVNNIDNKNKNNNEKLFNIGFNIIKKQNSKEFYQNLEILRKDYIIDDSKQIKKFGRGLKISVPVELEYSNFYQNCLVRIISTFLLFASIAFSLHFIDSYFFKSSIITFIISFVYYKKNFFFISSLKKRMMKKLKKCDYIAKATTIIDCDANKIYNILTDLKLRREWDNFIRKPEHISSKCSTCFCGDEFKAKFSIPENYLISSIANPLEYDVEIIKHMDDNENCYIIFKNKSEKLNFFDSEYLEIFLLIPLKDYEETKTLVIFLTNLDFLNDKNQLEWAFSELMNFNFKNLIFPNSLVIPYFTAQKLKEERLMILANLKEFLVNFNIFEIDAIINQIPNIKNLSISRSNTKNDSELRKIITSPRDIINGNVNGLIQNNHVNNNNYSNISSAYLKNNHNHNSNNYIYNNQNNKEHDYGNEEINRNKININNISKQIDLGDNIKINTGISRNNSNDNRNISNYNSTMTFHPNNGNLFSPRRIENNTISLIEPYESFYDACSEIGAISGDNILISKNGEIKFRDENNQLSNKTLTQKNYIKSSIDRINLNNFSYSQINPISIITNGKPIPLGERLENYHRNPEGGVECRNHEELRSQDGIILELMKRAGKQLLEGKNIVGVSLPVKIFEPRSTLTRLTDIWGTAYEYFNKAAENNNPVERMKMIITMAMSGLHLNAKQTKPFNPILGETYEAYWPDNSKIYMEHMSHHPPISRFLIIAGNKKWKFHGYYEYAVKIKSITGNVVGGQFKGPNVLEIYNPLTGKFDVIEYILPTMNISGMLYGKRIIEWEGICEFKDENNGIYSYLKFTPAPKFYQKFVEPTDVFRGEITQNDEIIHKVYGSPLEKIMFDDEIYWELEKCDIIKPMEPTNCLPSDCRYREDIKALSEKNIELADKEKVRLEVIQRADRILRQKIAKKLNY